MSVLDRTTRGTGQDIVEGFYGKQLRRGCRKMRGGPGRKQVVGEGEGGQEESRAKRAVGA